MSIVLRHTYRPHTSDTPVLPSVYSRGAFNDRGDLVRHLDRPQPGVWIDPVPHISDSLNTHAVDEIWQTAALLKSKGVNFCVVFPAVPKAWWQINGDKAELVGERLKGLAANVPASAIHDDGDFFDTYYHLNRQGRNTRNQELAAILSSGCHPI